MNEKLKQLLDKVGKSQSIAMIAKNIAKGIVERENLPYNEKVLKALEEAFMRGAGWQRLQNKKENNDSN